MNKLLDLTEEKVTSKPRNKEDKGDGEKAEFPRNKDQTEKSCDQEENAVKIMSKVLLSSSYSTHTKDLPNKKTDTDCDKPKDGKESNLGSPKEPSVTSNLMESAITVQHCKHPIILT